MKNELHARVLLHVHYILVVLSFLMLIIFIRTCFTYIASKEDLVASPVLLKFSKHQESATATIKVSSDDIVEQTESFQLKMNLPSKQVDKKLLKYGTYRHATVYIEDSKYYVITVICFMFILKNFM